MKVFVVVMHTEFYNYNTLCYDTILDIFQNEEDAKKRVHDTLIKWGFKDPPDIKPYVWYWCPDTHAYSIFYEVWEVQ